MTRWGAFRGRRDGSKYGNRPTRCSEGIMHHSQREARRCSELHVLLRAGLIADLEAHPQPRFDLEVNGVEVCRYIADFRYTENGETVVEDSKGHRTREYEFKRRLLLALHGIEVRET